MAEMGGGPAFGLIDAFKSGQQIQDNQASLKMKAVDIQRKREELQMKKMEVSNAKHQQVLDRTLGISNSEGAIQKLKIDEARRFAAEAGLPIDDGYWQVAADPKLRGKFALAIGDMLGIEDPEQFAEMSAETSQYYTNPAGITEGLGKYISQREAAMAEARTKAKGEDKSFDRVKTVVNEFNKDKRIERFRIAEESFEAVRYLTRGADERDPKERNRIIQNLNSFGVKTDRVSAFDDIALIFSFMKMLDPNSVVRESEYKVSGKAGSLMQRFESDINKVLTGEELTPEKRNQMMQTVRARYAASQSTAKTLLKAKTNEVISSGLDPNQFANMVGMALPPKILQREAVIKELARRQGRDPQEIRQQMISDSQKLRYKVVQEKRRSSKDKE